MTGLPIMATAPRVVLETACSNTVDTDPDVDWVDAFETTEHDLYNRIRRQRVVIITERMIRLLSDVYGEVKAGVESTAANLEQEQIALTQNTIRDLDGFISEIKSASRETMDDALRLAKREIGRRVRSERDDAIANIRKDLEEKTVIDAIKNYLEGDGAAKRLENANDAILSKIRRLSSRLQEEGRAAAEAIDDTFAAEYTKLAALGSANVNIERGFADGVQVNISSSIGNALMASANLTKAENTLLAGGAVAGATAGSLIFPIVGTIVGGVLGAMFGGMFAPSIADQRAKVIAELEPDLKRQFDKVETDAIGALETAHRTVLASLEDYANTYLNHYSQTVGELRQRHQEEVRQLRVMQQNAAIDIAEIDRRRSGLQATARKLMN